MVIERTDNGILIKVTEAIDMDAVQKLIDYITLQEIASEKQGSEEEAATLAKATDKKWWAENKHRFLK